MTQYDKGTSFERDVVKNFNKMGWIAIRAAGSGIGNEIVPDVIAIKRGRIIAFQCKSTNKTKINITKAKEKMMKFYEVTSAEPYIAIKFLRKEPRFFDVRKTEKKTITLNDNYLTYDIISGYQQSL